MNNEPTVVIVGRMNVGKSTLFNRLAENVKSITLDYEGVTRDYVKDTVSWQGRTFNLVDSGGIHLRKSQDQLFEKVREKVLKLIEESDVIVFMTDGKVGVLQEDLEISRFLHKLKKPVVLAVNKIDTTAARDNLHEFDRLGHTSLIAISSQHGTAINDLLDAVVAVLPKKGTADSSEPTFKVVFLGKPNVGKSSLMNALLKQERSIVSEVPGTTREAISESISFYKESIEITDTPGIRKKRSVSGEIEPLMVKSSFHALKESDIVVLLIDGSAHELADQELKLAFYAFTQQYKALIILVNKFDLMDDRAKEELDRSFDYYKHLIKRVPVLSISCKDNKNIGRVLPLIQKVWVRYTQKFDNAKLKLLFITALQKTPLIKSRQTLTVFDVEQLSTAPITILLKVNIPQWFEESQLNFFENLMRSEYDIEGVPVKFVVRKNKEKKNE